MVPAASPALSGTRYCFGPAFGPAFQSTSTFCCRIIRTTRSKSRLDRPNRCTFHASPTSQEPGTVLLFGTDQVFFQWKIFAFISSLILNDAETFSIKHQKDYNSYPFPPANTNKHNVHRHSGPLQRTVARHTAELMESNQAAHPRK